jgi:Fe-S cluster biogenesis protein NfuA/nitrite reductase/ring-hydroxylating ferredoxin subunit
VAWTDAEARERVARLDGLLATLDPPALDAVGGLVEVYGEALGRITEALPAETVEALARDELVGHLLLVHDLGPQDLTTRISAALDEVRPYLASHGGGVELVGVVGATVRLRLEGHCNGCPSSTATLRMAVEDAIRAAAPEIEHVEADGAVEEPATGLELPMAPAAPQGVWSVVGELPELAPGGTLLRQVSGEAVVFVRLDGGGTYAYRPDCPGCGRSLETAELVGGELVCAGCGQRYDVAAAGRCADDPALHLVPLPLLVSDGRVRIAHREAVAR